MKIQQYGRIIEYKSNIMKEIEMAKSIGIVIKMMEKNESMIESLINHHGMTIRGLEQGKKQRNHQIYNNH